MDQESNVEGESTLHQFAMEIEDIDDKEICFSLLQENGSIPGTLAEIALKKLTLKA